MINKITHHVNTHDTFMIVSQLAPTYVNKLKTCDTNATITQNKYAMLPILTSNKIIIARKIQMLSTDDNIRSILNKVK